MKKIALILTALASTLACAGLPPDTLTGENYLSLTQVNKFTANSVNLSGTNVTSTLPIGKGGTGQTTANPAFNALSPMTTSGDIIYGGASGVGTRLPKGSDTQVLTLSGGLPSWAAPAPPTTVAAFYTSATGTVQNNFNNIATYGTKVLDTNNAYSAGTYTIPQVGTYSISATVDINATYTANNNALLGLYVNGVQKTVAVTIAEAAATDLYPIFTIQAYPFLLNDAVTIRPRSSGTSPTIGAGGTEDTFSIVRIGN